MIVVPEAAHLDPAQCAEEPIHIPGSIQAFGMLLVLGADLTVQHVSANITSFLGLSPAAVIGAPLSTIFGGEQGKRIIAALRTGDFAAFNPTRFVLDVEGVRLEVECTVHRSFGTLIVELEPYDEQRAQIDVYGRLRTPIARLEQATDVSTLASVAATEVRAISGFDRAMVYRFDEDWNGEIIAEAKGDAAPVSYLGLHFPATDIPAQARRLYVKNILRLIPDVGYAPSLLIPQVAAGTGLPVDLSQAVLRSVSPYHVDYLQAMGVRATLTISIVVGGRLWGLIACHHYRTRGLDYGLRAVCELLGHMLAWQIGSRLEADGLQEELRTNVLLNAHGKSSRGFVDLATGLVAGAPGLLDVFAAQGLVLRFEGKMWRAGSTPDDDAVARIAAGLRREVVDGVAASHHVADALEGVDDVSEVASGALLIELSEADEDYVLCFREEMIRSVQWGGDPRSSPSTDGSLRPRMSFESWRETMRGRSARWAAHDVKAGRGLRQRILERRQTIERGRAEERIRHLAHFDMLTQLPNRASFHDSLLRLVDNAKRDGSSLAVLFVDIDRLKVHNDSFGHATGDLILQAAASRMRSCVRRDDVVARLGGDEFVVILPKIVNELDAEHVATKILAAVAKPFFVAAGPELRFTASVGIAIYPKDAREPEELLRHADRAMYRAKEHGRNDFKRFGSGDEPATYERLTFEHQLQQGLTRNELVPFYQPIVSADCKHLAGLEALARWNHPDLGLLQPSKFIALAEESGLIVALGEVMLLAACRDCVRWREKPGHENLKVSVNVSARQFREDGFLQAVRNALAQTGLAAEALQLELTESMLIGDEVYAMRTLQTLADAGISLAIDDFGTGYSSLSYLKRLPVDVLKIDRSFIADITAVPDDTAIVRAVIAMAHSLKLDVVAEGVETIEQLEFLRAEGCDKIQGYLIGKPLAHLAATEFIDNFSASSRSGQSALTAPTSLSIEAFASPKSIDEFGSS
ncbi:MAG: EAL domain-containing protein [Candidatus Eremiobacteraeota bacterium]|nr:EAL domain-containing protein [Candidatus Eremiobacteraeota bacterium]